MKKNGFTLVEMMAVIALVGLLAVIGVATYTRVNEAAKQKTLEAKKEQIRSSAMKWAKENSITNKTVISVNALVVEGYLTADENRVNQIGLIENPVTGDNMICNTVDISFKEGEMVAEVNDTVQNCDLATQSLVDDKIGIQVIDERSAIKTGTGSMSNWTNKNVIVVVSSSEYDRDAVSISFDFEGNTETKMVSGLSKYSGTAYLDSDQAKLYYNVFNVDANLLLNTKVVVSYTLTNGTIKSRSYTIRVDKEESTASVKSNNEWLTTDKPIYVLVDDGKGSGPRFFYVTTSDTEELKDSNKYDANNFEGTATDLEVGKYFIWTEDNAGNRSVRPKMILEVNNVDKTVPDCEVVFKGTEGDHGWYKKDPVETYGHNTVPAGISGVNVGVNESPDSPVYTAFAYYGTDSYGQGETRTTNTAKGGDPFYCHVKTLAGNYARGTKKLYLDRTPPNVYISVTTDTNYTQTKSLTISIQDDLSGLNTRTTVRYGWGLGDAAPTTWKTATISAAEASNALASTTISGEGALTGKYKLWIDVSGLTDYAGNVATQVQGASAGDGYAKFGPFHFDNTPPQCTSNNGKTNWTDGSYNIRQYCGDADGTVDQSGCAQTSWLIPYTAMNNVWSDSVVIRDKANNTRTCTYDVYLDNDNPSCNGNNGKSNWTRGSWTGSQNCKDNYSGCSQNPFTRTWTSSTDQSTITIRDNLGHIRNCSISVRLDTAAPTCTTKSTQAEGSWTNGTVTLTGECSDTGGSGCLRATTFPASFSDEQAQAHSPGKVADNAGNEADCPYFTVRIDKTKPYVRCEKSHTGTTDGVTVTFTANDSLGRFQSGLNTGASSRGGSGVKSTTTYTAYDYAGNSDSCTVTVSTTTEYCKHTRSAATCTKSCCGTYQDCDSEYKCHDNKVSCSGTATNIQTTGSNFCYTCTTCETKNNTCTDSSCCGYTDWSGCGSWGTGNYCSSSTCYSDSRILYS